MDLEQELRAALVPCRPAPALRAAVMTRVSVVQATRGARRRPNRVILIGTLLAVAAAAAMLGPRFAQSPTPPVVAATPVPAAAPEPAPIVAAAPSVAAVPESKPASEKVAPKEAVAAIKSFTVSVLPLQNDSPEVAVRAAVDTFHRALLDGLRATPGLVLTTPDSLESADSAPADYRLTLKGTGSTQANTFTISLRAMRTGRYVQPYQLSGFIAKDCSGAPDCGDASSMADCQLNLLRETMFPESPARSQAMRTQLLDPLLSARQRLDALLSLETLRGDGVPTPLARSKEGLSALRDPEVVRGALQLAAAATDDFVRAQVWKKMRGVGSAELIQPLITAARTDSSSNVRAEAVMTLATDFASDPRVRAALEAITHQESRPVVRVLAQSGLSGKEAWTRYVLTSVKDTSLSDLDRIEAIYYAMNQDQSRSTDLRDMLADDESIRAFVQVLPTAARAAAASPEDKAKSSDLVTVLISRLSSIDHPAITDMLLDAYEHPGWADPFHILNQLARRGADPRVRALLEKVSAEAVDSPLREIARDALKKLATPATR